MRSQPPPQPPNPSGPKPTPPPPPRPRGKSAAVELYPVKELARMWRCSDDLIYDLIARRELRSVQIGVGRAKTRIPADAAADFIRRRSA